MRRLVLALGGNALLPAGAELDLEVQRTTIERTAPLLAAVARQHRLVLTHGNGPQVGLLALQAAADPQLPDVPLDVLDAESEGMVGYLVAQALGDHLGAGEVVTLLTQVVVDAADPAFDAPVKAIGPRYAASEADGLRARGWSVHDDGDGLRRVVASPEPQRIVELAAVRLLSSRGFTVVCAGGGGIPVVEEGEHHRGVEAVVDKDLASARLAIDLDAAELVLVTGADAVYEDWDGGRRRPLRRPTVEQLRALDLPPGSMGPKVEAACRFVEATGGTARIGALDQLGALLAGDAGTVLTGAAPRSEVAFLVERRVTLVDHPVRLPDGSVPSADR